MAPSSLAGPAKLRSRRRAESGGAVIFVVAMTLALLASMGLYAMQSTSTEIATSGFARQSTQTHYMAEYGILGGAAQVQSAPGLYMQLMNNVATRDVNCTALAAVPAFPTASDDSHKCRRILTSELQAQWQPLATATPRPPVDPWTPGSTTPGSLGAIPFTGTFDIELTEPANTSAPAGYDQAQNLCFNQFTVTTTGMTMLSQSGAAQGAIFAGQGVEVSRARVTAGPTRCQK